MAAELVNAATTEKLTEIDWAKNIEICELVARDHRQAEYVIKAIKKRLGSKKSNIQLFAVSLLEMLMNNIGEPVHKQVINTGVLPILVKIVKKKSDSPVREKIFLLLDAAQTSLGGASGRFPQYYSAYYELVSAGVQFPQGAVPSTPNSAEKSSPDKELASSPSKGNAVEPERQPVTESSILEKARTTLEVLKEVLEAVDTRHPEAAKDEFTMDLVEQCSFQKQKVMHLAMTSRDDVVVSQAIELNEHLEKVLAKHDALISSRPTSASNLYNHKQDEEDEEEVEQLFRRLRKGKARLQPEDEDHRVDRLLHGSSVPGEMLHRPLIRPLTVEPRQENNVNRPAVVIPPPPAKHAERERFFQENKSDNSAGHMRGLSLHSRNASSSRSGSIEFSD